MQFGNVLKLLRIRNNLTQKELAKIFGVSESRIGMYERCQREPSFEMLETIADYFNVDMDYLTGRSPVERQYTYEPPADLQLSVKEKQLVGNYRGLNEEGQERVLGYVEDLVVGGRYEKVPLVASAG